MTDKLVPKRRFNGFTGDWEQRKLSELMTFSNGINAPKENYGKGRHMISVLDILSPLPIKYDDIKNSVQVDKNIEDKNKVENGDLVFVRSSEIVEEVGWAKAYLDDNYALYSGFTIRGKRKEKFDSYFFELALNYSNRKQLERKAGGSTRYNVSQSILNSIELLAPDNLEQIKIGNFFKQLDDTITLQERKLEKLKITKQAYLEEMFPKENETFPKRRFKGFTGDWEQHKLGEIADHRGGTAIEKYFDENGEYKVISIGSYGLDSKYVNQNIRAVSNSVTDSRVVKAGELTMVLNDKTANGTIIGRTLLIEQDNKYVINQRTEIISPKENFNSDFAFTILNGAFREKVKRIVQGGTQIYVNYPAVSNLTIELPNIEEQKKIGLFFKQLDNTITLQERKLEKIKKLKAAYLSEMFV